MESPEFKKLQLKGNENISVLDLQGSTQYGIYIGEYDPKMPSFKMQEKDTPNSKTIYLKELEKIFKSDSMAP